MSIRNVTPASLRSHYFDNVEAVPYDSLNFPNDGTTVYPAFQFEMPTDEELQIMGTMVAPEDTEESHTMLDELLTGYSKKTKDFHHSTDDLELTDATAAGKRSSVLSTLNSPACAAALPDTANDQATRNGSLFSSDSEGADVRSPSQRAPINASPSKSQKEGTSLRIRRKAAARGQKQQRSNFGKDHRAFISPFRRKEPSK